MRGSVVSLDIPTFFLCFVVNPFPSRYRALRLWFAIALTLLIGLEAVLAGEGVRSRRHKPKAGYVQVVSPEVPQTWSYFNIWRRALVWKKGSRQFLARVVFTNGVYADEDDPIEWQEADFVFPGVKLDARRGLFYAKDSVGSRIPLATRKGTSTDSEIRLLPTSRITLFNVSGKIVAVLSGSTNPENATSGPQWNVENQGWYLQNLLK